MLDFNDQLIWFSRVERVRDRASAILLYVFQDLTELALHLKIDPHIHSVHSDGKGTIEQILRVARLKGLDGVAITDHDSLNGYFEAVAFESGLLILPGFEVLTDAGHVLVLGLTQCPQRGVRVRYERLIRRVRDLGGITILAHPAAGRFRLARWKACKPDAVEVLNALYPSSVYFVEMGSRIAGNLGLPEVGGSDAHCAESVGDAYTVVEVVSPEVDDVVDAIAAGNVMYGGGPSTLHLRLRTGLGYLSQIITERLTHKRESSE